MIAITFSENGREMTGEVYWGRENTWGQSKFIAKV